MTQHNTSKLDRRKIFIQQGRLLTKRKVFGRAHHVDLNTTVALCVADSGF